MSLRLYMARSWSTNACALGVSLIVLSIKVRLSNKVRYAWRLYKLLLHGAELPL